MASITSQSKHLLPIIILSMHSVVGTANMSFSVKNKVALVTGAAGGIGLNLVIQLLKNGVKGITLVDLNEETGRAALSKIDKEFGPNKAIFVKADVGNLCEFESAIKRNIEQFKNLDILVNNAGIINDYEYEKSIHVNVIGTLNGMNLALENYIPRFKSGPEGVILNVSSVAGVEINIGLPTYCAAKFAINGLSLAFGGHYERTKVKVISVCPGATDTNILLSFVTEKSWQQNEIYSQASNSELAYIPIQKPEFCAEKMVEVIEKAKSGTTWVIDDEEPYQFVLPDRKTLQRVHL